MAEVALDDVLNSAPDPSLEEFPTAVSGIVTRDRDAEFFRVYDRADEPGSYLLLNIADVAGPLEELTRVEAAQLGFVGRKPHRVPLPPGTAAVRITSESRTLG